ncbi:GNAT family N-acetyltransferase [bacterium]|nr:GNAT family N-acetyltransferase [bacterium]
MDSLNNKYKIKPINKEASKRIWEIRNHPLMRKVSNNSKIIPFNQHSQWFKKKYFSNNLNKCYILIKRNKTEAIGYCRFDFNANHNAYQISIALDPDYHGKKLGNKLLSESIKQLSPKKNILAEIKKSNIVSLKLFQKNNFQIYKKGEKNNYLLLSI